MEQYEIKTIFQVCCSLFQHLNKHLGKVPDLQTMETGTNVFHLSEVSLAVFSSQLQKTTFGWIQCQITWLPGAKYPWISHRYVTCRASILRYQDIF